MKKRILPTLLLFLSLSVYSQTIIESPKYGFTTASTIKPTKIELTDTTTVLYFKTYCAPDFWIMIPDKTYIQQDGTGDKLFIKRTEGIPFNQQYFAPQAGEISYTLIFPPISSATRFIDYGEANDGGSWFIYDIQIKPSSTASNIPTNIQGNWFNTTTGNWEISFLDTVAVYKSKLWAYGAVKLKKGKGSIKLKNKEEELELFINIDKSGTCMIGETPGKLEAFSKVPSKQLVKEANSEKPYELPLFKLDSATYSGYFKGYTPRAGGKTFNVHIDDIIAGTQNTFLGKISDNGFFSVKLPVYYPHQVWVRSGFFNGSVFLEPGKTLFHMIDAGNQKGASLFMDESAGINSDLGKLEFINSFNYYEMKNTVLDMKPADYKAYYLKLLEKDMKVLDSVMQTKTIGTKAFQVKKTEIEYRYFCTIMEYQWNYESAYREKNKIPWEQRTLPVKTDSLTAEYYNFITNENSNNQLAALSSSYNSFINRLKYLDILRSSNFSLNTQDIFEELQKSGYVFTESEKKLAETLKKQEHLEDNPEQKAFNEKYGRQSEEFFKKYNDTIQVLYKNTKSNVSISDIEKYLVDKGVKLTQNEKELLKAMDENAKKTGTDKAFGDSLNAFHARHNGFVNALFNEMQKTARTSNLENILGVKPGFASDIMNAQDVCRSIVEEYTPVTESKLKAIQQQISSPFIAGYIALCNEQSKIKIEANKQKTDYVINDVPKTEADQLFDSIMQKYRGKVVYVDFWATWCGPCRMGIKKISPLKEEMAGENVVFVYITGPSSPQNTWANMIPDIKGEHYRVSSDEWNYLCSKFNIAGIPHYTLVGKNGEVINPKMGHMENNSLKTELQKWMND